MFPRLASFAGLVLAVFLSRCLADETVPTPTLEDFFGPELLTQATLSPDGTRLAGTATWKGDASGLILLDLATAQVTALEGSDALDIYRVYWHGNDRLLFNVSQNRLYSQGLYAVPADRLSRHIPIRLFDALELIGQPVARPGRAIIWVRHSAENRGQPGPLLEIDANRSVEGSDNAIRLSSTSSDFSRSVVRTLPLPEGTVIGFDADLDDELAFAFVVRDGTPGWLYWDHDAATWNNPPILFGKTRPLARDPDGDHVWIVTRDPERGSQLRRMGLATGLLEPPVLEEPRYDLREATLLFSRLTRELIGARYQSQRSQVRWFSEKFAGIQAAVDAALPHEEDHLIVDWDEAENCFLVRSAGVRQPGVFHVYDARERTLKRIGETMPALNGKPLARVTAIAFTARDGLPLEGYVTLPAGVSKRNPVPLIVLPHGGPAARDAWVFDAEAQFLASLGYAVLQPNYRGSAGYLWPEGSGDYEAAFGAMRDDVIDATRAALKSGLFDPARVAVMGSSFGGYLALACPVEEPTLYRCAVSVCGVFDWAEHVKSKRNTARSRPGEYPVLLGRLGDPRKNQEAYDAISPLAHLDRLRVPMLIAHGKEDSIASVKQSRLLAKELKRRELPHQTFYRSLAGHGFYAAKDRLAFYRTLENFLAENLAPPAP